MEKSRSSASRKAHDRRRLAVRELQERIVAACAQSEVTPREIAEQEGLPPDAVNYHFGVLKDANFLRISRKESVRGVMKYFYVAIRHRLIADTEFSAMSDREKREVSRAVLLDFVDACKDAHRAGSLDARIDSHLTWSPFELDELGWHELMAELSRVLERSFEIQARATIRLRKSGEVPVPTILAIAGFEGPAASPTKTAFTTRTRRSAEADSKGTPWGRDGDEVGPE